MIDAKVKEENLKYYNALRQVPKEATKTIQAGRLKGMTDIKPIWRIERMTEVFGPCGEKWWFDKNVIRWTDDGPDGQKLANVQVTLYVVFPDGASKEIVGIGGAYLVAKEREGLRLDDEAWKKAYTDAQSTAFKLLGAAADVYWGKDSTKYTSGINEAPPPKATSRTAAAKPSAAEHSQIAAPSQQIQELADIVADIGYDLEDVRAICESKLGTPDIETLSRENYDRLKNYLVRVVEKTKQDEYAN